VCLYLCVWRRDDDDKLTRKLLIPLSLTSPTDGREWSLSKDSRDARGDADCLVEGCLLSLCPETSADHTLQEWWGLYIISGKHRTCKGYT
jgi:hypothetical protein